MALQSLKLKFACIKAASSLRQPYLTASLDSQFVQDPSKHGKLASYCLLKVDEINGREWGVTSDSIPENSHTCIGMPLSATGDRFSKDSPYGNQFLHSSISHCASRSAQMGAGYETRHRGDIKTVHDR